MRILALYLSRQYLKLFGFMVMAFVGIYSLFDFIEKVDNFTEAGVPTPTMLSFFVLQVPEITCLLAPMAVLMATIITLGMMGRNNEIVAIKASGISMFRFTLPIVLISLAVSLLLALVNESVVPEAKARTNYIWDVLVEKRPGRLVAKENFWYKGHGSIYKVGFYDEKTQSLSKVSYYQFDKKFQVTRRVDARRARFLGGDWVFFSGLYQERLPDGTFSGVPFDERALKLPEKPGDFSRLSKPSEEMSLAELASYVRKVEQEGYDSTRYRVDLMAKISFPFVCLIMALLGVPLALLSERKESLAPAMVIGMGAAVFYWISFSYIRSLFGYSGVLPPVVAAWLPNAVFGLAGLWMFSHVKQ